MFIRKKYEKKDIIFEILMVLNEKGKLSSQEINQFLNFNEKDILINLRQLISENKITINNQNKYLIK